MELRNDMRHLVRPSVVATIAAIGASLAVTGLPYGNGWLPLGAARSDRSLDVRISSERVVGLYPGARRKLIVIFHNTSTHRATIVRDLRVTIVKTTKRTCAGSRRNLRIRQYDGPPIRLRPNARRRVVLSLTMPGTVANACQHATFTIHYRAQTWLPSR